jgi:hypothetical protein
MPLSRAVTGGGGGAVADNSITNAKLRDSAALSVIGRATNSGGDPADIAVTANSNQVLRESGGALAFGQIAPANVGAAPASGSSYIGMPMVIKVPFTASGTPGTADDITIDYSQFLPAGTTWELYDAQHHIETAQTSATGQVFTAAAGAGTQVTTSMAAATANVLTRNSRGTITTGITSATTHFYRRSGGASPAGTVGHLRLYLVRTG